MAYLFLAPRCFISCDPLVRADHTDFFIAPVRIQAMEACHAAACQDSQAITPILTLSAHLCVVSGRLGVAVDRQPSALLWDLPDVYAALLPRPVYDRAID
jgi:hypothetical protein